MNTLKQDRVSELGRSLVERPPNAHPVPLLRPLPFERMPLELIQDIFSLACPEVVLNSKGTVAFHFKLSLVCRKWCDIVAGHRSLWATFEIRAEGEWNPKFGAYLRKYLQHSGTRPLNIVVQMGGGDEGRLDVLDAIIPHCGRWATIKLDMCLDDHFLQKLKAIRDQLSFLQRVRIIGPINRYPPGTQALTIFRDAPLLTRVTVDDFDAHTNRVLALPWNRISRANLDSFSFENIHSSLELSETLTTLTLVEGYLDAVFTPAFLESACTLKALQVLRVREKIGIGHLTCPSLKLFEVWHEDASAILKLLDNSSCSLVHLQLRGFGETSLSPIIQHKSLASLTFLHLEDYWINDGALDILIFDRRRLLPVLKTLYIDVELDSDSRQAIKNFKTQIGSLRRVVESRTGALYGRGLTLPDSNTTSTKGTIIMPLKECRFTFRPYRGEWDRRQEGALKCLRSFCNSRDVLAILTGFGVEQDNDPCNARHCIHIEDGDSNDSDNGDYGDYSDYSEDSGDDMT